MYTKMISTKFILVFSVLSSFAQSISVQDNEFVGTIPSAFTPFNSQMKLNLTAVEPYMKFLKENGITSVLICASIGEGVSLTLKERKQMLDATLAAAMPDLKVILEVGGLTLQETLDLSRYAAEAKVDAIMTLPNAFFRPTSIRELVWYLEQIALEAPETPLFYNDFTAVTKVSLDMVQLFKVATCRIQSFVGIKTAIETGLQVIASIQLKPYQRILASTELSMAEPLASGINATVTGITNIFPKQSIDLFNAVQSGDAEAYVEQEELNKKAIALTYTNYMRTEDNKGLLGIIASFKVGMDLVNGIPLGPARRPLPSIGIEKRQVLAQNLMDAGVEVNYPTS